MGEGCAERLWGMFALAVWDEDKRRLLLAGDRFGKKPLFYAQAGGHLLFASEIKALLRHPALHPTLDARSLEDMFTAALCPARRPSGRRSASCRWPMHWWQKPEMVCFALGAIGTHRIHPLARSAKSIRVRL